MKTLMIVLSLLIFPFYVHATQMKCEYAFSGSPAGNVTIDIDDNGVPGDMALVSLFFAPAKEVPVTNEAPAAGELLNLTLAKGDPNNEIQMIVYPSANGLQKSKLINPSMPPIMKELNGSCQ